MPKHGGSSADDDNEKTVVSQKCIQLCVVVRRTVAAKIAGLPNCEKEAATTNGCFPSEIGDFVALIHRIIDELATEDLRKMANFARGIWTAGKQVGARAKVLNDLLWRREAAGTWKKKVPPSVARSISLVHMRMHNLWEDGMSPGCNTPHWTKAQQVFPLVLSTWKKECKAECR